MEVINTNIQFKIEMSDLDLETRTYTDYYAHLWDKESGVIEHVVGAENSSDSSVVDFIWAPEKTEAFADGQVLTLEVFTSNKTSIYYKDRFARIRKTSVADTEESNTVHTTA